MFRARPRVSLADRQTPRSGLYMDRYEFHLTGFAEDLANLEAIHALLTQYRNPEVHIVVTVSPVPLMNTFSTMDIVSAELFRVTAAILDCWYGFQDMSHTCLTLLLFRDAALAVRRDGIARSKVCSITQCQITSHALSAATGGSSSMSQPAVKRLRLHRASS